MSPCRRIRYPCDSPTHFRCNKRPAPRVKADRPFRAWQVDRQHVRVRGRQARRNVDRHAEGRGINNPCFQRMSIACQNHASCRKGKPLVTSFVPLHPQHMDRSPVLVAGRSRTCCARDRQRRRFGHSAGQVTISGPAGAQHQADARELSFDHATSLVARPCANTQADSRRGPGITHRQPCAGCPLSQDHSHPADGLLLPPLHE